MARTLLFPFSLLYRLGLALRSGLYRAGLYKRTEFDLPLISVGNLSTGGTGKTPHIEYLIRLLNDHYPIATLSRGYGRKTTGFKLAGSDDTADTIGDEPMQYHHKFRDISVAVGEQRALAIPELLMERPETQVVLLDDAFQHLAILPGLNILLTEYSRPYTRDRLLPMGNLREPRSAAERANIIIVTKCPPGLGTDEQAAIRTQLAPLPHQSVYFTTLEYDTLVPVVPEGDSGNDLPTNILLLTGIARPEPLLAHLKATAPGEVQHLRYPDHHRYTLRDAEAILKRYHNFDTRQKAIITTEKDWMRLLPFRQEFADRKVPVWVQPVRVKFLDGQAGFDRQILQFIEQFPTQTHGQPAGETEGNRSVD